MPLELLFLGSGTSAGVPMIGCDCPVCRSTDPRDQRFRPSVLVSYPPLEQSPSQRQPVGSTLEVFEHHPKVKDHRRMVLIDTAPELRLQMIRHRIHHLDAVLFTHAHADHIFGLDDLRRFNAVMKSSLDIYAEASTLDILRSTFWYIFNPQRNVNQSFVAQLTPHALVPDQPINLYGVRWTPLQLLHGKLPILGFRVDCPAYDHHPAASLAYCTDISCIPQATMPRLRNLDVLVIDALRYHPHPTHMTVQQALAVVQELKPRRAYFTHIAHDILHADLEAKLPEHIYLAFDGLTVQVNE